MRILVSGGSVLSSTGAADMDVLIDGERVAALAAPGTEVAASWAQAADRVLDASGRYVLPGGIDAHTHMEMPFGGTSSVDTFETGTRAAAWGGTTTIIDFAVQTRGTSTLKALDTWHAKAHGKWVSSNKGAGSYKPAPGSVQGWAFGASTAPRISPP